MYKHMQPASTCTPACPDHAYSITRSSTAYLSTSPLAPCPQALLRRHRLHVGHIKPASIQTQPQSVQEFLPQAADMRLPACKCHPPGVSAPDVRVVNRPSAWQGLCSLTPRAAAAACRALCSSGLGPLLRKPRCTFTQYMLNRRVLGLQPSVPSLHGPGQAGCLDDRKSPPTFLLECGEMSADGSSILQHLAAWKTLRLMTLP